jgi:hypothetical protein
MCSLAIAFLIIELLRHSEIEWQMNKQIASEQKLENKVPKAQWRTQRTACQYVACQYWYLLGSSCTHVWTTNQIMSTYPPPTHMRDNARRVLHVSQQSAADTAIAQIECTLWSRPLPYDSHCDPHAPQPWSHQGSHDLHIGPNTPSWMPQPQCKRPVGEHNCLLTFSQSHKRPPIYWTHTNNLHLQSTGYSRGKASLLCDAPRQYVTAGCDVQTQSDLVR